MSKDTNGPAFPAEVKLKNPGAGPKTYLDPGMTLRDYFAAKAMAAQILAIGGLDRGNNNQALDLAAFSYAMADAMLQAREVA